MQLPDDLVITFMGIYPREMKIYIYTNTQTRMFIEALSATTKKQKQCLSMGKQTGTSMLWNTTQQYKGMNY